MGKSLDVRLVQVNMISNLGLALMAGAIAIIAIIYAFSAASKTAPWVLYVSALAFGLVGCFIFYKGYSLSKRVLKDGRIK
jgi:glucan phosphoethanolaminetransferase (alkaline phosphatase superfamily)